MIIEKYRFSDEQAVLARIRYNRLIDLFLGITAYSLQNHLRTTVSSIGQIEVDEIYVGTNKDGAHFIMPVQAKVGKDKVSVVQARQDIRFCQEKFVTLISRTVSAQSLADGTIALLELTLSDDLILIRKESHYSLWPPIKYLRRNLGIISGML